MLTREVRTEIEIAAPPQAVWDVMAALDRWSEWNPIIAGVELRGPLREGTRGRLMLELPVGGRQSLAVRLCTVRPPHELVWEGGVRGVVKGRHGFRLEETSKGTRLHHYEAFSGVLAPALVRVMRGWLGQGYRRLNEGLRNHCEHGG
ncbi:SRPBCC domain-containing protein [Paraliomyxa miuraensis]|uniref:SRPBCC domain-containing protein n=1 Tax=Paraliomyxa miuraensis TaxID=376150 RepID=UPI002258A6FA|nr:SRPBCC domain-containing protein [Paraliomyxa miuraensis]MCX4247694.1 SRPBCC domain-containing protein [Paraliomyxa miuraensis]